MRQQRWGTFPAQAQNAYLAGHTNSECVVGSERVYVWTVAVRRQVIVMLVIPDSITGVNSLSSFRDLPRRAVLFDEILNQVQNDKLFSNVITYY